jgi:hypothetical protein
MNEEARNNLREVIDNAVNNLVENLEHGKSASVYIPNANAHCAGPRFYLGCPLASHSFGHYLVNFCDDARSSKVFLLVRCYF